MDFAMQLPTDQDIDRLARKRAGAKMGWYLHAMLYIAVNGSLLLAHAGGFGHRGWPISPALGWGLGLAVHGLSVFVLANGSWRERLVARERERLLREHDRAPGR
jgi:hypothetical protein